MGPQGSGSCSTIIRYSCAPRRKCREVSSGILVSKAFFFFFQSQRAGLRCTIFKPYFNDLTPGKASVTSCTLNIGSISGAGLCLTGLHPYAKHTFTDVKRLIKPAPVFISHVQNASNCGASQACVKLLHTDHQRRAKIMVCCTFGSQEKQTRSERKQT